MLFPGYWQALTSRYLEVRFTITPSPVSWDASSTHQNHRSASGVPASTRRLYGTHGGPWAPKLRCCGVTLAVGCIWVYLEPSCASCQPLGTGCPLRARVLWGHTVQCSLQTLDVCRQYLIIGNPEKAERWGENTVLIGHILSLWHSYSIPLTRGFADCITRRPGFAFTTTSHKVADLGHQAVSTGHPPLPTGKAFSPSLPGSPELHGSDEGWRALCDCVDSRMLVPRLSVGIAVPQGSLLLPSSPSFWKCTWQQVSPEKEYGQEAAGLFLSQWAGQQGWVDMAISEFSSFQCNYRGGCSQEASPDAQIPNSANLPLAPDSWPLPYELPRAQPWTYSLRTASCLGVQVSLVLLEHRWWPQSKFLFDKLCILRGSLGKFLKM